MSGVAEFCVEKTLEFGIRAKGRRFSQEELLGQLKAAEARKSDIVYGFVFKGLSRFTCKMTALH